MQTKVRAIRRGTSAEVDVQAGQGGDLSVSLLLPPYAQLSAAGKVFGIESTAGTALPPVNVVPTTTATWALYNANSSAHLVILKAACAAQSGTLGLGGALVGTVTIGDQTALVANYSGVIVGCLDGTAKQPNAFLDDAISLVGTQSPWVVLAARDMLAVVAVGAGLVADVDGMMVVPPKGIAGFDVLAPTGTTALFDISIIFAEIQLDLA